MNKLTHRKLSPCRFYIGNPDVIYDGFTDGTTWNGFDNVMVSPKTHKKIIEYFGDDVVDELLTMKINNDGLFDYSNGFITQILNK